MKSIKIPALLFLLFLVSTVKAQTPLSKALSKGDTLTALALIKAGEDPNQLSDESSLLISYCRYTESDTMAYFL
ncbi:MAG: hypothetical protein ACOYKE_06265, partial [Ferruginibacter sp.]